MLLSSLKNDEETIYSVNVALVQLLPLINSPPYIEKYECEENEVKLLCPVYNTKSGRFLGLEKRLAVISVMNISFGKAMIKRNLKYSFQHTR